jgi:hypothetical protein
MAQFCAECGHAYDDIASEAGTASDRCCPECGSDRVNASVSPATVEARTTVPTPSILLTAHLRITWLRVAIERAQQARRVREEMVRRRGQGANAADLLNDEFEASIVAVAASAHALDALYGSTVIPQSVRAQWRRSSSSREGHIREALKGVFDTGTVNTPWVTEFGWLFDLRDSAAHAREEAKPPQPHPIAGGQVSGLPVSAGHCKRFGLSCWSAGGLVAGVRHYAPYPRWLPGLASGRAGQGARSARMAAPEAPLRRLPGSKIIGAAGEGAIPGVRGSGPGLARVLPVRGGRPWRRGMAKRGSQAYLGPRALAAPGDMMIDRVSPPARMRPLSLFRPSACPARQGGSS